MLKIVRNIIFLSLLFCTTFITQQSFASNHFSDNNFSFNKSHNQQNESIKSILAFEEDDDRVQSDYELSFSNDWFSQFDKLNTSIIDDNQSLVNFYKKAFHLNAEKIYLLNLVFRI